MAFKKRVLESTTPDIDQTHLDREAIIPADSFPQKP